LLVKSDYMGRSKGDFRYSENALRMALESMGHDEGFNRVLRLMLLVPIIQMGMELHHSVHEMATVLSLNYQMGWHVGHYTSLYEGYNEFKQRQDAQHAQMKSSIPYAQRGAPPPPEGPLAGFVKTKLNKVDEQIKKILEKAEKNVMHGYYATSDPHVTWKEGDGWGATLMESRRELQQHRVDSFWDTGEYSALAAYISNAPDDFIFTGINEQYLQSLKMMVGSKRSPSKTVIPRGHNMGGNILDMRGLQRTGGLITRPRLGLNPKAIQVNTDNIWLNYIKMPQRWR
jgi:hypothetical protein